jgi:hypothetical protein
LYGLDPVAVATLVCEEHMSDEASGPDSEDDTYDSHAAWKTDLARLRGMKDVSRAALATKSFLEVITPDWRSQPVIFNLLIVLAR